jgi:hypothetical protein
MKKENKKNIVLFIFIFIAIFSIIIKKPITDLDELWNYNTARAISEGLIPYKDISMITTPLLPMLTSIFLKLITNEIIISRILAALLCSGILFMTYKILRILIKEENMSLICTALIGILLRDAYCIDYNFAVLLISLIILYRELKNLEYQLYNLEDKLYDKKEYKIYNKKEDLIIRNFSRTSNLHKTKYRNYFSIYNCNI